MSISKIAIIGLGLIGGSIAASIKNSFLSSNIVAFDPNCDALQYAKDAGIIDASAVSIAEAIYAAELIIIAAPISTYTNIFREINMVLKPFQVVTDVASVKEEIIAVAEKELGKSLAQFIPGHPLAGSEKSGVRFSSKMLFNGRKVLLTPSSINDKQSLRIVTEFWQALGATVNIMRCEQHDQIIAITSHLPHILSYAFMNMIKKSDNCQEILKNTGGSFADFTRIAASDSSLWADVCLSNRDNLLAALNSFEQSLNEFKLAITSGEQDKLIGTFRQIKLAKDLFSMEEKI